MDSLCLLFLVLATGLEMTSCFEDNTKNIVLIKIYDLKWNPFFYKKKFNQTSQPKNINLSQASNDVLHQGEKVNIVQDNLSNLSERQIETFEKFNYDNESLEASHNTRSRKSINEYRDTENFPTLPVNPNRNVTLIESLNTEATESNTLVTESITRAIVSPPLAGTIDTTTQGGMVNSTPLIRNVSNAEEIEPTPSVLDFLPQLSGDTKEMYYEECSGLIIKQDFVLTTAACVRNIPALADSFANVSSTIYHIRIQIILFDGAIGYAKRSYLWNQVLLLQVYFEEETKRQYHLFFPHKSIPLGASIPSECRVEGHVYTETKGKKREPQYTLTYLGRNAVYKHCPASASRVDAALLKDYDNVMCAYSLDGADASESMKSLCNYLPGASLFCPELQGLLYMTYLRSKESTSKNFAGDGSIYEDGSSNKVNYQDDTISVVNEILDEYNLTKKVKLYLNETLPDNQTLTDQSNRFEFDILQTEKPRLNKTSDNNRITALAGMNRTLMKSKGFWREQNTSLVTRSKSCGSAQEVALFVNTHFNVIWIKRTVRTYTRFRNKAVRCGFNVNNLVMVSLTVLVSVLYN